MYRKRKPLNDDPWSEESKFAENITSIARHLVQPVYVTLILSALFYVIISCYYISFFNKLSLPFYTLNLPLTFYIAAGTAVLKVLLISIMLIPAIYLLYRGLEYEVVLIHRFPPYKDSSFVIFPEQKKEAEKSRSNETLFIMMFLNMAVSICALMVIIKISIYFFPSLSSLLTLLFPRFFNQLSSQIFHSALPTFEFKIILSFLILIMLFSFMLILIIPYVRSFDYRYKLFSALCYGIALLVFLLAITSLPAMIGAYNAEYLISVNGNHFELSNIILKDKNISVENKTFILITECNGNYYLIEKNESSGNDRLPISYILREDQVSMAIIKNPLSTRESNTSRSYNDTSIVPA